MSRKQSVRYPNMEIKVRAFIVIGYSRDYGSCGFTRHHGDAERVVLDLTATPSGRPGEVELTGVYTAAHEGTPNDRSQRFTGAGLWALRYVVELPRNEPRWVVFASLGKHASFVNVESCERRWQLPCFAERCNPDGPHPERFDRLPPILNVGEADRPRVTALDAAGFPGEQVWTGERFCGGLSPDGCSSPMRGKLLVDPFGGN